MSFDLVVIGAGPAGSACAITASKLGLRVLLIDRENFPRHKVCGDCLNPAVLPLLRQLGVYDEVLKKPHAVVDSLAFSGTFGKSRVLPTHGWNEREIVIRREVFDHCLLEHAARCGVEVETGNAVLRVEPRWKVSTKQKRFSGRFLVAADGRNSFVARTLGWLSPPPRERTGFQCHVNCPPGRKNRLEMAFFRKGYGGIADCGDGSANLCLVSKPGDIAEVRKEALEKFGFFEHPEWSSISPVLRPPATKIYEDGVFLVGDSARVVEPFTGEGIYHAIRTGILAARAVVEETACSGEGIRTFLREHAGEYRARHAVNVLSSCAGKHPAFASFLLQLPGLSACLLPLLTRKVIRA